MLLRMELSPAPQSPLAKHRACILAFLIHNSSSPCWHTTPLLKVRRDYLMSRVERLKLSFRFGLAKSPIFAAIAYKWYFSEMWSGGRLFTPSNNFTTVLC